MSTSNWQSVPTHFCYSAQPKIPVPSYRHEFSSSGKLVIAPPPNAAIITAGIKSTAYSGTSLSNPGANHYDPYVNVPYQLKSAAKPPDNKAYPASTQESSNIRRPSGIGQYAPEKVNYWVPSAVFDTI